MTHSTTRWNVDATALKPTRLLPPISKSDAQRAQVLSHLLHRPHWASLPTGEDLPSDVLALARGLRALAEPTPGPQEVDCADGGAPFRLLLGQAAVTPGAHLLLRGTQRLGERPHGPLLASLRAALGSSGLTLREGTPWPLEVQAPRNFSGAEPVFRVAAAESSQFPSSLLLAAAALLRREGRPWTVELEGPVASEGYLGLTLAWMLRTGFTVERQGHALTVREWREPPTPPQVPGDWSSLGYLLLLAWRSGGTVLRADLEAHHPDRAMVRVLKDVGLSVREVSPGELSVRGEAVRGFTASGEDCPDLLPTLAALACVLPAESRLDHVHILRGKESDRLAGILELVRATGAEAIHEGNRLILRPKAKEPGLLTLDSHGDHRLAMSAATLAVLTGKPLLLTGPECVSKSFPGFWTQLAEAGVRAGPG